MTTLQHPAHPLQPGPMRQVTPSRTIKKFDYHGVNTNLKTWLGNVIQKVVSEERISEETMTKETIFVMDMQTIMFTAQKLTEEPIGLMFSHAFGHENFSKDFTFLFYYSIDKTDPAKSTLFEEPSPRVEYDQITRTVKANQPIKVAIVVDKITYEEVTLDFNLISGQTMRKDYKKYIGLNETNPLDEPNMIKPFQRLSYYMERIDRDTKTAASSLARGHMGDIITYAVAQSPSMFLTLPYRSFTDAESPVQMTLRHNSYIPHALFGLNKRNGLTHFNGTLCYIMLSEFFQQYCLNTNNITSNPHAYGHIEGGSFDTPAAIMLVCPNTYQDLRSKGMIHVDRKATVVQYVAEIKLSDQDVHPFHVMAPHTSIHLNNHRFIRDEDGGIEMTEHRSVTDVEYITIDQQPVIVSCLTSDVISDIDLKRCGMKTLTTFDTMIPTNVAMSSMVDAVKVLRWPTATYFYDDRGVQHKLQLDMDIYGPTFGTIFHPTNTARPIDTGTIKAHALYPRGYAKKLTPAEVGPCFLFFHPSAGGPLLNYAIIDNFYMDKKLYMSNVISAYDNYQEFSRMYQEQDLILYGGNNPMFTQNMTSTTPPWQLSSHIGASLRVVNGEYFQCAREVMEFLFKDKTPQTTAVVAKVMMVSAMVLNLQNCSLWAVPALLKIINPGMGLLWVKEEVVDAESIVLSRPNAYTSITSKPYSYQEGALKPDCKDVHFQHTLYAATCKQSTNHSSIKASSIYHTAFLTHVDEKQCPVNSPRRTNYGKMEKVMAGSHNHSFMAIDRDMDVGFHPIFCAPRMEDSFFSSANSPVGRLGTHYSNEKHFNVDFFDRSIKDVKFPSVYTVNPTFYNPLINLTVTCLYDADVLNDDHCVLKKYISYNAIANDVMITSVELQTRIRNTYRNTKLQANETLCCKDITTRISHMIGAATPRMCASSPILLSPTMIDQHSKLPVSGVVISGQDFFITGTDMLSSLEKGAHIHHRLG